MSGPVWGVLEESGSKGKQRQELEVFLHRSHILKVVSMSFGIDNEVDLLHDDRFGCPAHGGCCCGREDG